MVKITASDKRNPVPQSFRWDESLEITTWGTIKINQSHFFPSSFRIKSKQKTIFIDPVEVAGEDKADYIFLTHAHPDHFSLKDLKKIAKPETVFICPKGVTKKLHKYNYKIVEVKPGDTHALEQSIKFEAVPAYNTKSVFLWIKAHPKSKQNVGYILSFYGTTIYHAGDTDYIPEMEEIKNVDIAMVPVGGDNLTMNAEDAAKILDRIRPKVAIPMHYEIKKQEDLKKLGNLVGSEMKIKVLH